MSLRTLGTATDYDQLLDLVRRRIDELQTRGETVDEVAGLPDGYTSKLLCKARGTGVVSLGPLMSALGMTMLLQVDDAYDERIKRRLYQTATEGSRRRDKREALKADIQAGSELSMKQRAKGRKRWEGTTPEQRTQFALFLNHKRWKQRHAKQQTRQETRGG